MEKSIDDGTTIKRIHLSASFRFPCNALDFPMSREETNYAIATVAAIAHSPLPFSFFPQAETPKSRGDLDLLIAFNYPAKSRKVRAPRGENVFIRRVDGARGEMNARCNAN